MEVPVINWGEMGWYSESDIEGVPFEVLAEISDIFTETAYWEHHREFDVYLDVRWLPERKWLTWSHKANKGGPHGVTCEGYKEELDDLLDSVFTDAVSMVIHRLADEGDESTADRLSDAFSI